MLVIKYCRIPKHLKKIEIQHTVHEIGDSTAKTKTQARSENNGVVDSFPYLFDAYMGTFL